MPEMMKMEHPDSPGNVVSTSREAFEQVWKKKGWTEAAEDAEVFERIPAQPDQPTQIAPEDLEVLSTDSDDEAE